VKGSNREEVFPFTGLARLGPALTRLKRALSSPFRTWAVSENKKNFD
jgi:hypothetical protein